jgi:hypothetical protein
MMVKHCRRSLTRAAAAGASLTSGWSLAASGWPTRAAGVPAASGWSHRDTGGPSLIIGRGHAAGLTVSGSGGPDSESARLPVTVALRHESESPALDNHIIQ